MTLRTWFSVSMIAALAACGPLDEVDRSAQDGEEPEGLIVETDCSTPGACPTAEEIVPYGLDGMVQLDGATTGKIKYTHLNVIGDSSNITRVYFLIHGDGNSDYSSSTASDRKAMAQHLAPGEGAIVAYPVSKSSDWPGFGESGNNGKVLLQMFRHLEKLTNNTHMRFEQFSLSGGGRVNHALLRLINENYASDSDVREFVDNHVRGIHDGDSLCYGITSMRNNYIKAIQSFPKIRACFIHNTSGYMKYVQGHHNTIAKTIGNQSYSYGGSLTLQDGRLRFWSSDTHWHAWSTQFEKVFFGTTWGEGEEPPPTPPTPPTPPQIVSFIGGSCKDNSGCESGTCLGSYPDGYLFPEGMCTQPCDKYCPDQSGEPTTFCTPFRISDGYYEGSQGYCFAQCDKSIYPGTGCRNGYACVKAARNKSSSTNRNICVPADK